MRPPFDRASSRRAVVELPLVVAVALLVACASSPVREGATVTEISGAMPGVSGEALQGGAVGPGAYAGRPVVVNFWATWCGPCRREQPALSAAERASGPDGPVFVGVNFRDDPAAARAYLREFHVPYPSVEDPAGTLAYRFDVPYLPATIFVDAGGQMRYRAVGALDRERLDSLIEHLMDAGSTPSRG